MEITFSKNTNGVNMISIGKFKITVSAFTTLCVGVVACIVMFFMGKLGMIFSIVILVSSSIAAYNINCAQLGHCSVWAWILVALNAFWVYMFIIRFILMKSTLPTLIKKAKK